jgi:antitoxin component of RelBE/YafQ-DinJ toxin-antitoxin module
MSAAVREQMVTIRMNDEEAERAHALAEHFGINVSGVVRMLLKEKARSLGIEPKAASAT